MVTFRDDDTDLLFHALAHRSRRRILDILKANPGQRVVDVADRFRVSRIAVQKHLAVLSEAGLVVSRKDGRERRLYLNPVPIQRIHQRWTDEYGALFGAAALELKRRIETAPNPADNAEEAAGAPARN